VRVGRYGPFVQRGEAERATRPRCEDPAAGDLTVEKALALLKVKAEGPKTLGEDPWNGLKVYVQHGRFGHYVQLGETPPRVRASRPTCRARVDPASLSAAGITLDQRSAPQPPRDLARNPADARSSSRRKAGSGPYVKARRRVPLLEEGDRRPRRHAGSRAGAARAPKKEPAARHERTVLRTLGAHPQGRRRGEADGGAPTAPTSPTAR